jgi:squalene cyclase
MGVRLRRIAVCALLVFAGGHAAGRAGEGAEGVVLSPRLSESVEAGVAFLMGSQNPDGSWLTDGRTGRFPTAITALAGLALLANGNTTYSGPHAEAVHRAVEFLVGQADAATGLIGRADSARPMFGHGYAMLFLAEVYGSESEPALGARIGEALRGGVRLTAGSQGEAGGWYYDPGSDEDEGAVTVTQLQGLRACADAGIPVPAETVERALAYVRSSARADGGIAYRADGLGDSRPGITCAAVATMYAAGLYDDDMTARALAFAVANTPRAAPNPAGGAHFLYSHLYLSQVLYFQGGAAWRGYFDEVSEWLLEAQHEDGHWDGDYIGKAYGTAVALLVLQLPYNSLPVLQR